MPDESPKFSKKQKELLAPFGLDDDKYAGTYLSDQWKVLYAIIQKALNHTKDSNTHSELFHQSESEKSSKFSDAFRQKLTNLSSVELLDLIYSLFEVDRSQQKLSPDSKEKFISTFVANLSDEHKANLIDYVSTQLFGDQNDFSAGLKEELKNLDNQTVTHLIKLIVQNQAFQNELKVAFPDKKTEKFDEVVDALSDDDDLVEEVAKKVAKKRKFPSLFSFRAQTVGISLVCLGATSVAILGFNPESSIFGFNLGILEIPGLATEFEDTMKVRREIDKLILTSVCDSNQAKEIFSEQSCRELRKHFAENDTE